MDDIVTRDFSRFGFREIKEARDLLTAYIEKNCVENLEDGIELCFNVHSGYVFLCDEHYNTAMVNPDSGNLENWLTCPTCGAEGFKSSFEDSFQHCEPCCAEYLSELI